MKMIGGKLNPMLIINIGRVRRSYDEGENAGEIMAVMKRPVTLVEKWVGNFKIIDQKRRERNG